MGSSNNKSPFILSSNIFVKPSKSCSLGILTIAGCITLAGCGSGGESSDPVTKNNSGPNTTTQTFQHWVPTKSEYYTYDGDISSCMRSDLDSDGNLLSTTTSSPSTDTNSPVECNDDDLNSTFTEFTYSADRSEFSTYTESTFAAFSSCQSVKLSSENMPYSISTFISASGNFTCSVSDGLQFSLQQITLEEGLFETLTESFNGSGSDGVWGTSDDSIQARFVSTWSNDRLTKSTVSYYGSGVDGTWDTSDDLIARKVETTYTAVMIPDFSISTSPGADGVIDTDDDVVMGITNFSYEDGKIKTHSSYATPGIDGQWETFDDNYKQFTVFY